jgi:predicted Zn-dependent protease
MLGIIRRMPLTHNQDRSRQRSGQASSLAPGAIYGTNFEIHTIRKIAVFIMVSWSFFWTLSLSASAQSAHAPEPRKKTARKETLADKEKRQRAALGLNAQSPELHGELGRTLIQAGRYEEATRELGLAANRLPDSRLYNMALVEALLGWGHWGVAVDFLNAVQPRFQQFPEFHYYMGLADFRLNKNKEALAEFQESLRIDPTLELAKFGLAATKASTGDLQGSAELSRGLVKQHPSNARYWLALAQILDKMGEPTWAEALQAGRRALALRPGDPAIELKTAVIMTHLGNYIAARPLLEHVVQLQPQNVQAHVTLATTYSHLGESALARKESAIVAQLEASQQNHAQPLPDQLFTDPN